MPVTFVATAIGVLSISGIPPFSGFFSKDDILLAVSQVSTPLYVIAVVTAFMTAFYMSRMLIVVFCGPEKPENSPHEAPVTMMIPLVVLSILSIIGGYIPYAYHFGDWVRFGVATHEGLNFNIALLSTLLSIVAMLLAWLVYGSGKVSPDLLSARFPWFYKLSYHKYYIDELYLWLNHTFVDGLGKVLYWVDINIVDGIVNGLALLIYRLGGELRQWQTGYVQQYGLVLFGAILIMVAYLVLSAPVFVTALWGGVY